MLNSRGLSRIVVVLTVVMLLAAVGPQVAKAACNSWGKCSHQTVHNSNWIWWEEGQASGSSSYVWKAWAQQGGAPAAGGSFDYMKVTVYGYNRLCGGCSWTYMTSKTKQAWNSTFVDVCSNGIAVPSGGHSPKYKSLGSHRWEDNGWTKSEAYSCEV